MAMTDGRAWTSPSRPSASPRPSICARTIVAPGGHVANVGVHGKSVELHLENLWIHNITITTGLVSTNTTPMLRQTVQAGTLKPAQLITHRFPLGDIIEAYRVFGDAAKEKAMKVILYAA